MKYIIPDRVYDVMKWVTMLFLPALTVLFTTVAPLWGMDAGLVDTIGGTLTAVTAFLGAVLGLSAATGKEAE